MLVYLPVFRNGKREVQEIDSNQAKYRKTPGYSPTLTYKGSIYNAENIYTTAVAAVADWNRDTKKSVPYLITWGEMT